jgi:hypothetical protein
MPRARKLLAREVRVSKGNSPGMQIAEFEMMNFCRGILTAKCGEGAKKSNE